MRRKKRTWKSGRGTWWVRINLLAVLWAGALTLGGGGVVLVVLFYRLVSSRRGAGQDRHGLRVVEELALLRDFEKWLARRVGPRPLSQPMGTWLRQHLGVEGISLVEDYERLTFREMGGEVHLLWNEIERVKKRWRERQKNPEAVKPAGL